MLKNCEFCGKEFEGDVRKKYCNKKCKRNAKRKRQYKEIKSITYTCTNCGKEYHPMHKDRNKYCSRECAFEHKSKISAINKEKKRIDHEENAQKRCPICGKHFIASRINEVYCSDDCRRTLKREKAFENYLSTRETNPFITKICKHCGAEFKTNYLASRREFCSPECATKFDKHAYKAKRKEFMKRAFVEPVGFKYIYKRDKGICQICGNEVAYDKTPENIMGATIDHIIPLSKGGRHQKSNCQLAHRICNCLKGDKIPDGLEGIAPYNTYRSDL